MKRILFLGTLLSVLMFSLFTSCKKDDADDDFQVRIENYSNEAVSFYVDGKFQNFVQANYNYNQVITFHIGKTATFEVRSSSGKVLDSKVLRKGDSYVAIINPSSSDEVVSDTRDEWSLAIEVTNHSSSFVHVYIDGVDTKIVSKDYVWTTSHTVINQSSVKIEVKSSSGDLLDSKIVTKGGYYRNTVKDLPACLNFYNATSDNYMIYVDGEYICTVAPGKYSSSIMVDLGSHRLYAKQKDGYILWATEKENTYNFTESFISPLGVGYTWDFKNNRLETAVG